VVVLLNPRTHASKFIFRYHPEYEFVQPGRLASGSKVRV
jgi:hypothetical protein